MASSESAPTRPSPPLAATPLAGLLLLVLGAVAMGGALGNALVQDDIGVIASNPILHHWSGIWRSFAASYWPPADSGELYRPLSSAAYTVQWMLGGGAPLIFRIVSLALYATAILLVWRLLRELVSAPAAWIGAAIFAVHPVHVETVTMGVNQSELMVAILLTLALTIRIRANRAPTGTMRSGILIATIFTIAVLFKEHALVLPGMLLLADLLLDRDREALLERWRRWRWNYAALVVIAALFWTLRTSVLGSGAGTNTAEALVGSGILGRSFTMIGVPAEWLRLFLWPDHLQSDWNMLEWVPSKGWSLRETAGAMALLAFGAGFVLAVLRRPVAAVGLGMIAVALAPVANIAIPTGIIIAERTLFLASVGLAVLFADLADLLVPAEAPHTRRRRLAALSVLGILLALGVIRSAARMRDWKDRTTFVTSQYLDAPNSWHARLSFGMMTAERGDTARGRVEIRRAMDLRQDDILVFKRVADAIRLNEGKCRGAILIYHETLKVLPRRSDARGSLVACLTWDGRYAEALTEARLGVRSGLDTAYFSYAAAVADSAERAAAPAASVRLRSIGAAATVIGPRTPTP
jgi:hypothetical protein